MTLRIPLLAIAATLFVCARAFATDASPAGVWKTVDDKTGQPKSIVEITEQNGELTARSGKCCSPIRARIRSARTAKASARISPSSA